MFNLHELFRAYRAVAACVESTSSAYELVYLIGYTLLLQNAIYVNNASDGKQKILCWGYGVRYAQTASNNQSELIVNAPEYRFGEFSRLALGNHIDCGGELI